MEIIPSISRITIYPVKSLDGIDLQKAQVAKGGCLHHDREYAMTGPDGRFIIGKTNPRVHSLRSEVDLEKELISFRHQKETSFNSFHLQNERSAINEYLSDFFGMPVTLQQNKEGRFLDIPDQSGITVLSTASLQSVSHWFNDMDMEETRRRFRATIEITGAPAFWEDLLFAEYGTAITFSLGDVSVMGISPRARCVVPTRHPVTGEVTHAFPKLFARERMATLPDWSVLTDYDHAYYLSVDCYLPATEIGKWLAVGDELKITGRKKIF